MKTLNLVQGSPEWIAARRKYRTASEASMMKGAHKTKRNELLHLKATGTDKEFSQWVQKNLLDQGHKVEALARPMAEAIIDDELFPVIGVDDDDYLLASFDGLTMDEAIAWECKSWNEDKVASVRANICPKEDIWQVIQQLVVSGAEKCLYMVTDGTPENTVHLWVYLTPVEEQALIASWKQFDVDLANYVLPETNKPVIAEAVKELPAVTVHVKGELTLCNLDDVTPQFDKFLNNAITKFETDEDFANAEAQAKVARSAAKKCEAAANSVIDQMLTVSDAVRTLREYRDKLNALGLAQEKSVKSEKQRIKESLIAKGNEKFNAFMAVIHTELSPIQLVVVCPDFASSVKNKRTMASLTDAVDTELSECKIKANEVATLVRANLKLINEKAVNHKFLFNDLQQIIHADALSFSAFVESRIARHVAKEQERLEVERERIRLEEEEKAQAAVVEKEVPATTQTKVDISPASDVEESEDSIIFTPLAYQQKITTKKALTSLGVIIGKDELALILSDDEGNAYDVEVIVKRVNPVTGKLEAAA